METFLVTKQWILENYKKYNKKYWNNELPLNIEVGISRSKNTFGYAKCAFTNGKANKIQLYISNYYELNEHSRLNTLLHEMIHIADYVKFPEHYINRKYVKYDSHGPEFFLKEAARINKDGWSITRYKEKSELVDCKLSEAVKARLEKPYVLAIFNKDNEMCAMKIQEKQMSDVRCTLKRLNFENIEFYNTNHTKFREKRCSKRTYYRVASDFVKNENDIFFNKITLI